MDKDLHNNAVILKLLLQSVVIVFTIMLIGTGWIMLGGFSGKGNFAPMIVAGFICLVTGIISMIPLSMAVRRGASWLGEVCLAGTAIRLLLTLFAIVAACIIIMPSGQMRAFVFWTLGFYFALLIWETLTGVRYITEEIAKQKAKGESKNK